MDAKKFLSKLRLKNLILLTIAGIINAIGVTVFIAPVKLYDSGISGTSILLSQITPEYFSLSFFLLILNVPLFLYGLKKQGGVFTVYAIYSVVVYSFSAWLITDVLPVDVSMASPLAGTDLLLCALFGWRGKRYYLLLALVAALFIALGSSRALLERRYVNKCIASQIDNQVTPTFEVEEIYKRSS